MATPPNQSVMKAFALLNSFDDAHEWLSSAELSRRAKLPGASGYRLLQTLERVGAVIRSARGRYRPLVLAYSRGPSGECERLRSLSEDILEHLAQTQGLTAHMGVLEDGMVTYVAKYGDQRVAPVHTEVGAQLEAYCTGLGKVLLASLPEDELQDFLGQGDLVALTDRTITDPTAFRAEMARVNQQGYAVDDREHRTDLRCVAVPVRDRQGKVVASVSVSGPADHMEPPRHLDYLTALRAAGTVIGARLSPSTTM